MNQIIRENENWELSKTEEVEEGKKVIIYELRHKYDEYIIRRFINWKEEDVINIFNKQY